MLEIFKTILACVGLWFLSSVVIATLYVVISGRLHSNLGESPHAVSGDNHYELIPNESEQS